MRAALTGFVLAMGVLGGATAHAAAPLVTPALPDGTGVVALCRVVNAGTQAVDVTIDIVNTAGVVEISSGLTNVIPGRTSSVSDVTPVTSYCRVTGISKSKARVTFCMQDASGNCLAVVALP